MRFLTPLSIVLATACTTTYGFEVPVSPERTSNGRRVLSTTRQASNNGTRSGTNWPACPSVWWEISTTMTKQYLADGQCTDAARAAIRAAFHDW